jgi:ferric-chelate reductase
MSFANFPLLFLFGGRNNILIWATGWSFATFNVFHRHVARIATLQAVAHSVLYLIIYIASE